MSRIESLKDIKVEDLDKVTGGTLDSSGVSVTVTGVSCPKCKSGNINVLDEDDYGRMKLQCRDCKHIWENE